MIIYHQDIKAAFVGGQKFLFLPQQIITQRISETTTGPTVFARPLVNSGLINRGLIDAGLMN